MTISFNEIPINLRVPGSYIKYDSSRALQGVATLPKRVLLIGNRLTGQASGSQSYQMLSNADADYYFGTGSQISHMVQAFKAGNSLSEVWACGLEDADGSSPSQWTVSFSGSNATQAGTLHFLLGGRRVDVGVSVGDDGEDLSDALAAAMEGKDLAFTYADTGLSGTFESRHSGSFTADLDIRLNYYDRQRTPAGVNVSISQTQAGTTNPDVQDALDNVPDEWFTHIGVGYDDSANMTALETHAETQWGPTVQRDAMVFVAIPGTYSDASTWGQGRNSKFSTGMGTGQSPTPAYEWAASYAAVDAKEPDPARPRRTLRLPGILPPARNARFSFSEKNLLLNGGVSTYDVDASNAVTIQRAITTYQTNAAGGVDATFLDTTTLFTIAALRYSTNARILTRYPRHKLASDGIDPPPGQAIVTPSIIRSELIALYSEWAAQGWVEPSGRDQFIEEIIVQRSSTDANRIDAVIPPDLINQFLVFAGQIQFIL